MLSFHLFFNVPSTVNDEGFISYVVGETTYAFEVRIDKEI